MKIGRRYEGRSDRKTWSWLVRSIPYKWLSKAIMLLRQPGHFYRKCSPWLVGWARRSKQVITENNREPAARTYWHTHTYIWACARYHTPARQVPAPLGNTQLDPRPPPLSNLLPVRTDMLHKIAVTRVFGENSFKKAKNASLVTNIKDGSCFVAKRYQYGAKRLEFHEYSSQSCVEILTSQTVMKKPINTGKWPVTYLDSPTAYITENVHGSELNPCALLELRIYKRITNEDNLIACQNWHIHGVQGTRIHWRNKGKETKVSQLIYHMIGLQALVARVGSQWW